MLCLVSRAWRFCCELLTASTASAYWDESFGKVVLVKRVLFYIVYQTANEICLDVCFINSFDTHVSGRVARWCCPWYLYLVKPTLGPPKKFQHLTRAEEVVITRLRVGHTKATKSHILSRGPPTGCHHCGQTLTIDHMLLECALVQECRDEYYTDSLNAHFEKIPETCIVEFMREAGFFYLIWSNSLTSTSPQTWTIWSDLSNCLENESNAETHLLV